MASILHPGEFVKGAIGGAAEVIGDYLIEPTINVVTYTPVPLRHGELALIRRPTNDPWPMIHDFAFTKILPSVFALLILGYALAYVLRAIPGVGYQRQQIRGNIISALIVTPWAWPLGVGVLALMDGLTRGLAPPASNLSGVLVSQLVAMVGIVGAPGPNILAAIVGVIDVIALIGVFLLYLFRIFYLLIFMQLSFLIVALYAADFPYLKRISQTAFSVFVKLSYAPIFMAATLALTDVLFSSATSINLGLSLATDFIYGVASLILPIVGIGIYIMVLVSSVPGGKTVAAGAGVASAIGASSRSGGKPLGAFGSAESDDYEGWAEEKAANLDEKLQDSTKRYTKTAGQRVDDHMAEDGTRPSEGISSGISRLNDATPDGPRDAARSAASTAKSAQASISTSLDSIFPDSTADPPETTAEPAEPLTDEAGDVMGPSGGAVTPINPPDTDTQGVIVGTGADETSNAGQPSLGSFFPSEAPPGEAPPAETDTPEPPADDPMSELDPTTATAPDEPVEQDEAYPDSGWTHVNKTHLERAAESHPEWSRSDLIKRLNETEQRDGRKAAERKAYQLATGQAAAESATAQDVDQVPPDSIPDETTDTGSAAPETTAEDTSQEPADTVTSTRLAGEDSSDSSGGRDPVEVIDPNEYLDREYDKEPPLLPEEVADD